MALLQVLTALAVIAICRTAATEVDSYRQIPSKFLEVPAYATQNGDAPQLSLSLEIPREEAPVPFDTYVVPSADLRAPDDYAYQGAYYPAPSQDLQVPSAQAWNPDNDPALLYELPVEITKETAPTGLHPKKYDKAVFEKTKPASSWPKEEVALVPIKVQDYVARQKQQDKALLGYAKQENQKLVRAEKVKRARAGSKKPQSASDERSEPTPAATGFDSGAGGHFDAHALADHRHPVGAPRGDRVEFQMHGYDGPKSYKWGYDTGKGHNRQFRYEESNKDGYIKGHYGYYDKHGKLRMVHYDSHPHDGFHAEGNFGQ